jgi:hypothetical protein
MAERYAGKNLVRYLGSGHSAVGLVLAFLGLPALILGMFMAADVQVRLYALGVALWGLVALPLGFSMRRTRPSRGLWILANAWLWPVLLYQIGSSI